MFSLISPVIFSTSPSSLSSRSAFLSSKVAISLSTSLAVTVADSFFTPKFVYFPSFTSGRSTTLNVKTILLSSIDKFILE